MESRKITIVSTKNQTKKVIMSKKQNTAKSKKLKSAINNRA